MDPSIQHNCRKECTLVMMSTLWILLSCNLAVVMAATVQVRPPNYRATLIKFYNGVGSSIRIHCTGWPQALDPQDRVIENELHHQGFWDVNYGHDLFQERLFCEFHRRQRHWNCLRELTIPRMCVWENPQLIVSRGSSPSPESCPICDVRNYEGEIMCRWAVRKSQISLFRWDLLTNQFVLDGRNPWVDVTAAAWPQLVADPQEWFHLEFQNYLEHPVTLHCGVRGTFRIQPFRDDVGMMLWERRLHVVQEAASNGGDSSWVCDVVVHRDGRRWRRFGIRLWDSPVGFDCDDDEREPPCIDCAWSLHQGALWVDRRGCDDDGEARWDKRYNFFGRELV